MVRPLVFVALLLGLQGTFRAADSRTDAFAVGVMRRDGAIVPFAAFDGKRWSIGWPAPSREIEIPINIESVPKGWWGPTGPLREWQLVLPSGETRTVHVTQPDWVESHCVRQVALRTDYRSDLAVPPPEEQPYPKDGLVISPPRPIERIEHLAKDGEEAQGLLDAVREAFNKSERETADHFGHPFKQAEREKFAIELEAVYAFGTLARAYYVEAGRTYAARPNRDECLIAFGTGWFKKETVYWTRKLDMAVDLLPCDRYGGSYMLPLGVLRIGARTFWIVQYSGWDRERYVVAEIKKDTVEAAVVKGGGGC